MVHSAANTLDRNKSNHSQSMHTTCMNINVRAFFEQTGIVQLTDDEMQPWDSKRCVTILLPGDEGYHEMMDKMNGEDSMCIDDQLQVHYRGIVMMD